MRGVRADVGTELESAKMKKIAFFLKFFGKTLADSKNSSTFALAIGKQTIASEK